MNLLKDIEERANEKLAALSRRKKREPRAHKALDTGASFVGGAVASSFAGDIRGSVDAMKIRLYESINSAAKPLVEKMLSRLRL